MAWNHFARTNSPFRSYHPMRINCLRPMGLAILLLSLTGCWDDKPIPPIKPPDDTVAKPPDDTVAGQTSVGSDFTSFISSGNTTTWNGFTFQSGGLYIRSRTPGVLFALNAAPNGQKTFVYLIIFRHSENPVAHHSSSNFNSETKVGDDIF
jgi:hypothetical protein